MEKLVFDLFKDYEIYLVGGYVRDKLLGVQSHDLDFATNATPEITKKILEDAKLDPHTVGWAFGTVGFFHNGNEYHITTYRKNEKYERDNRHPVVEWGKTLDEDLARRDFTINALAMDKSGEVIDLFQGMKHLKEGTLQTPINADTAFAEDPLRILRAIRFASKLNFGYSIDVTEALKEHAFRVMTLSEERILDEFTKILLIPRVVSALADMMNLKILNYIIPELTVLNNIEQDSEFHFKNVWEHTISVVMAIERNPICRWAALFHDIGKPYTFSENNGRIHFYKHEEVSAFMAESIMKRIGLPNKWIKQIVFLVRNHMRPNLYEPSWSKSAIRRFSRDMGNMFNNVLELSRSDITSHKPATVEWHLQRIDELRKRCEEEKEYKELKCPLNGDDIMDYFQIGAGPEIGKKQKLILEALLANKLNLGCEKEVYFNYLKEVENDNN